MDRKGPEHHYDELESPENGRSIIWQQGEVAPDHVNVEGEDYDLRSPSGGRPYRGQPSPLESEMDRYRDMPLDGASDDEGGNQFRTDKGILASKQNEEDLEQLDEATEPKGLGEINPVKDNDWPSGEITTRPARDEMLGSVRHANDNEDEDKLWDEVVDDFEHAEGGETEDMNDKVAAASWLENSGQDANIPVEHLGWDIVDVVEPSREHIEAANKYTMPMPQGITDAVHEALIQTNAWVENPEENGKLRPYKQYWSSIKPKIVEGNVQIAVEDPHMADIINHVARTDDLSALSGNQHFADTYRVPNPLGPGPVQRIPISPAEQQFQNAIKQTYPSGYQAYPSGHGEPSGTRDPSGRILPQQQRQPAGDQPWNDPTLGNPPSEWETELAKDPNAYGAPQLTQQKDPNKPVTDVGKKFTPPAIQLGLKGLQKVFDPSGMMPNPAGGELRRSNNSMERTAFIQGLVLPALAALGRAALPAIGRMVGGAMSSGVGGSLARGMAVRGLMNGGGEVAQEMGNVTGPEPVSAPTITASIKKSIYGDDFDHPSTVNRRVQDPENGELFPSTRTQTVDGPLGDQEWQRDYMDVNEIGQSRDIRGDDYEKENLERKRASSFSDDENEVLEQFVNLLPKIIDFFNSEESGEDDPELTDLHSSLESIFPGYQDLPDTPESDEFFILFADEDNIKEANAQNAVFCMMPNCGKPVSPDLIKQGKPALCEGHASEQSAAGKQGPDASPYSVNKLTEEWVPNINDQTQQLTNMLRQFTGSDTQGPHTDEQQAAVAEMLIEQGRVDEIPSMLQNPADYDEELAEIQNKDPLLGEDPEDVGMGAQDQMAQMGMGPDAGGMPAGPPMGGEMPPGPPGAAPGIPDMSAPTPADLNPAGPGAMPPPIMASVTSSMLDAAFKYGADNVAGTCPKCDSHTTKMVQQDGKAKCHTCGHEWQDKTFQRSDGDSSHSTTTSSFYAAMDSFVDEDVEEEIIDDSSHTWTDENGEPLEEGQEYEIYAHNYEIPDVGRVVELKPDAVVYEIESDGGLRTTIEIDRQEADLNGYRFAPTVSDSDEDLDDGTFGIEDKIAPEPGQTTDLSTPHREIGASAKEATVTYYMCPVTDCPNNQGGGDYEPGTCSIHNKELVPAGQEKSAHKTAGKHYTPMEQRELIDEYGQARNADKLNLDGTHYADAEDDHFLFGC